jgi:hypothetical protein
MLLEFATNEAFNRIPIHHNSEAKKRHIGFLQVSTLKMI